MHGATRTIAAIVILIVVIAASISFAFMMKRSPDSPQTVTETTQDTLTSVLTSSITDVELHTTTSVSTSTVTTYNASQLSLNQQELLNASQNIKVLVWLTNMSGPVYQMTLRIENDNPFNVSLRYESECLVTLNETTHACGSELDAQGVQLIMPHAYYGTTDTASWTQGQGESLGVRAFVVVQTPFGNVTQGPILAYLGNPPSS